MPETIVCPLLNRDNRRIEKHFVRLYPRRYCVKCRGEVAVLREVWMRLGQGEDIVFLCEAARSWKNQSSPLPKVQGYNRNCKKARCAFSPGVRRLAEAGIGSVLLRWERESRITLGSGGVASVIVGPPGYDTWRTICIGRVLDCFRQSFL